MKYKPLKEICRIIPVPPFFRPDVSTGPEMERFAQITSTGQISNETIFFNRKIVEKYALKFGDVLFHGIRNRKNTPFILFKEQNGTHRFLPSHKSLTLIYRLKVDYVIPEHLLFFLNSYKFPSLPKQSRSVAKSTDLPLYSDPLYSDVDIPIPSLSKQKKINNITFHFDQLKKKIEYSSLKIEELKTSLYYQIFGDPLQNPHNWKSLELSSILTTPVIYGKRTGITPSNAINSVDDVNDELQKSDFEEIELQVGDIIIYRQGNLFCLDRLISPTLLGPTMLAIRVDQEIIKPEYLTAYLSLPSVRSRSNYIISNQPVRSLTPQKHLLSSQVLIPPLELQNMFVDPIKKIEVKRLNYNNMLQSMQYSIEYKAFSSFVEPAKH